MPHIIIEYSQNIEASIDMPALLAQTHDILAAQGIDRARIKTRGIAVSHAVVGNDGANGAMAHITLLLLEGRDTPTKQQYGTSIHEHVKGVIIQSIPDAKVTLEVRDMDKDTYIL